MVSIIDYIEWLEADSPSPALATTPEQPGKLARGRPTKTIALARQAAAKQKNGGGE